MDETKKMILDAVVERVLEPLLRKIGREVKEALPCTVKALTDDGWVTVCELGVPKEGVSGEVRVSLKPLYRADRFSYEVEALFKGVATGTGFSGFDLVGKLRCNDGNVDVTPMGKTVRYNVWDWVALR